MALFHLLPRFDRGSQRVTLDDVDISPQVAPARIVEPEGYLEVDAYVARDGLLRYSDGKRDWVEYRPLSTLQAWAPTGLNQPTCDDHPPGMLDATIAAKYVRGHAIAPLEVVKDGRHHYLKTRLRWIDAELIDRILSGEQAMISVGVVSKIYPAPNGVAPDGTRCDAWQSGEGPGINHYAGVVVGRSGPAVRNFTFDGADIPVPWSESSMEETEPQRMDTPGIPGEPPRADALGTPAAMVPVRLPDGSTAEVPPQIAELIELGLKAKQAPAPAAPAPPVATEDSGMPPEMTRDSIDALVRERAALTRRCQSAGVEATILDSADVPTLQRAFVRARTGRDLPEDADVGSVYRFVAATPEPEPEPEPEPRNDNTLWSVPVPRTRTEPAQLPDSVTAYLKTQGKA